MNKIEAERTQLVLQNGRFTMWLGMYVLCGNEKETKKKKKELYIYWKELNQNYGLEWLKKIKTINYELAKRYPV